MSKKPGIGAKVNRILQNRSDKKFTANMEDFESNAAAELREKRSSVGKVQEQIKQKRKVTALSAGLDVKRGNRLQSFINFGNWPAHKTPP